MGRQAREMAFFDWTKLKRLGELSPRDLSDLAQALLLLPATGLGLRVLGFERTRSLISAFGEPVFRGADPQRARAMAKMVALAARYGPYRTSCLRKALALRWMLARAGIPAELRLGVRRGAGARVEAHAWVESEGVVLLDESDVDERFARFDELPDH